MKNKIILILSLIFILSSFNVYSATTTHYTLGGLYDTLGGSFGTARYQKQQFTATNTTINQIGWVMGKNSSSTTGTIVYYLYSDNANQINTKLHTFNETINISSLTTSRVMTYIYPANYSSLSVGTKYWIVLNWTSSESLLHTLNATLQTANYCDDNTLTLMAATRLEYCHAGLFLYNDSLMPPATTQTNISFYAQSPSDITSTTLFNQNVNIAYNVSNLTDVSNVILQYKVNHNDNCYGYLNGTCYFLNNTYYNQTSTSNTTQIYNWSLGENNIYHSVNYLNYQLFNQTHNTVTLNSANDLYRSKVINFSLADNLNYYEAMVKSTGTTSLYYCNSSYSTGNPATSTSCSQIYTGIINFNHTHNSFSNHSLFVFSQNSTGYVGNVKATSTSYFIFKGSPTNTVTLYTIPNSTNTSGYFSTSINNGVSYTDNSATETLDSHIHQFSLSDQFIYRGCLNKSGTFECTSETTETIDESIFPPVGVQILIPNASTYQRFINITYVISQHPNTPIVNNSYVNITLFNSTGSKIAFIKNNSLNTSYYWDSYLNNLSINTNYYLEFNITDTYNKTTSTISDLFNFSTNSYINISATSRFGSLILNFSINVTDLNTSLISYYNTTNGLIYADTIINNTYNISIDATGYAIENTTKLANQKYNNYTFNLYTTNSFNISFYDEVSLSLLNGLNISLEIISNSYAMNYSTNNGTLYFDLISPDTYTFRYKSKTITDYPERIYIVELNNRSHIDLNLYLVNTTTVITVNIKDQDDNIVQNAYLKVLRYDIVSNTYTLREITSTNVEGNAYFSGILNTEFYKFIIEYPLGIQVDTTNPDYLRSTSLTLRINLEDNPLDDYFTSIQTTGTLTFNNVTNNFRFEYNDATNTATMGCLYVYRYIGLTNTLINSSCTASGTSAGIILLNVSNISGYTYVAQGTVKFGTTEYLLKTLTHSFSEITQAKTKNNFFFLTILLTAIISLLFLWNITIALIITPLPIFLMSMTGMIPISRSIGITLLLIGITLSVVISKKA